MFTVRANLNGTSRTRGLYTHINEAWRACEAIVADINVDRYDAIPDNTKLKYDIVDHDGVRLGCIGVVHA